MNRKRNKVVGVAVLFSFTQFACYNTYFIDKTELEKLESTVEPQEVVEVYGDCPGGETMAAQSTDPVYFAQAETEAAPAEEPEAAQASEAPPTPPEATATDASASPDATASPDAGRAGCTRLEVSTANAVQIVTADGDEERVTPFNFIMSGGQLVSPEYDLLVDLDDVRGAEVNTFSTWKTVGTIVGVSAVAVGTFVGISLLAPDSSGFSAQ